jgi:alpha-1,2-mannosyltransferase
MLSAVLRRCQDYARIGRPMLIYGLGLGLWLADFLAIGYRLWPRLLGLLAGARPLNTPVCGNAQCDFSMFWPAGLLARAHQFATLYQSAPFLTFRQHVLTPATQRIDWIYPPPTLLLTMPASMLPFDAGTLVWTVCLTLAGALCLRWARLSWPVIACTLLCPAAMWNYECVQISLFTSCLLVAGLLRTGDAPWRAGALLGLVVIKPQLALLLGAAMLATRNWRAILATGTSALAICGLVTLLLGPQVWQAYFTFGAPVAAQILDAPLLPQTYEAFGISVFWMFRSLGAGLHMASAAQSLSAVAAIGLTWCIWRSRAGLLQKLTMTGWATLLATPYGYTYDLIAAAAGMAALVEARGWRLGLPEPAFWVWPALSPLLVTSTGYELTPCITVLALIWYWHATPRPVAAQLLVVPAQQRPGAEQHQGHGGVSIAVQPEDRAQQRLMDDIDRVG